MPRFLLVVKQHDKEISQAYARSSYLFFFFFAGGWYILRDWNIEDFDARFLMKELQVKYGVAPFIEVSVRPNPQIPGRSSISISPSGLGLPAKSYYYGPQDDKVK